MRTRHLVLAGYTTDARGREYARYRDTATGETREVMIRPGIREPRLLTDPQARDIARRLMDGRPAGSEYRTVTNLGRSAPVERR